MSDVLIQQPAGRSARDREADARPPLSRLTRVELRKMVDTRSGFWLQLTVVALTVLVVVITLIAGHEDEVTFRNILGNALVPAGILLAVAQRYVASGLTAGAVKG